MTQKEQMEMAAALTAMKRAMAESLQKQLKEIEDLRAFFSQPVLGYEEKKKEEAEKVEESKE